MKDKNSSIKKDIIRCRKLIEQQLNWGLDTVPARREYELLTEKIFEKTGVLLSLSTIRRIWNDDFKNLPHKTTLDALAVFAGFTNWQNFIESQVRLNVHIRKTGNPTRIIITALLLIVMITAAIVVMLKNQPSVIEIAGPIVFDYYQKNDSAVPNIIVFDYDVRNIIADSFFIVESSNDYKRKKLSIKRGQLTSSYFQPGNYEAFLLADDSIVRKLDIEIMSNSWIGMIKYLNKPQDVPYYFYENDIIENGIIGVKQNDLIQKHISISDDLYLTISNTFNIDSVLVGDFIYEAKIRLDSLEISLSCPKIYVGLLFQHNLSYLPLVHYGGQSNLQLKFGETYLTSNDSDLSGFGCNIYEWQKIRVESNNNLVVVILNEKLIASFSNSNNMGNFKGFSFTFDGTGSVDDVFLSTKGVDTVYYNDFSGKDY